MSPAIGEAPFVVVRLAGVYARPRAARTGSSGAPAVPISAHEPSRPRRRGRGDVAIGLAPVVPLVLVGRPRAFAVPDVHFYAVSVTAFDVRRLAVVLGAVGVRRHDRRAAGIGAGFTVMAALLAVHGLTTPGFLVEGEYTAAVGVSGALAVPLGGAVILAALLSRPAQLGYVRDLVLLQVGVVVAVVAFGPLALLDPEAIPEVPCRFAPARVVGRGRQRADLRRAFALRALRTFQLTRRIGDLAVSRASCGSPSPSPPTCSARSGRSASGPGTCWSSAPSSSSRRPS